MCTNLYIFIKFHYLFNSCQRQFLLLKVILKNAFHKNYAFLNHTLNYVNLIHLQNHNQFNCWFYLFIFKIHITKSLIIIKSIQKKQINLFQRSNVADGLWPELLEHHVSLPTNGNPSSGRRPTGCIVGIRHSSEPSRKKLINL